jgi:hypothetical protein
MRIKPCSCGSGKLRYENYDARGIFLCFTCSACHAARMARYRPEVLTNPGYTADERIEPDD